MASAKATMSRIHDFQGCNPFSIETDGDEKTVASPRPKVDETHKFCAPEKTRAAV
jgi:hypothetical protein